MLVPLVRSSILMTQLTCVLLITQQGERMTIIRDAKDSGWYVAQKADMSEGLVPHSHVEAAKLPGQGPDAQKGTHDGKMAKAVYGYRAQNKDELSFMVCHVSHLLLLNISMGRHVGFFLVGWKSAYRTSRMAHFAAQTRRLPI
jgi:hypothetical protein